MFVQFNMKRQIAAYLSVPFIFAALLSLPGARYALLAAALAMGLFFLWFVVGWYLVTNVLPSRKLSSKGKAVFITGEFSLQLAE